VSPSRVRNLREPERDYSHRSLLDKLGVKPGQRIWVLGVDDAAFERDLVAIVPAVAHDGVVRGADLIFLAADDRNALARMRSLKSSLKPAGAIWVVFPKGQKHIREVDVIAAGKAAALTDNKVCRFSQTHTALRFVVPLARR